MNKVRPDSVLGACAKPVEFVFLICNKPSLYELAKHWNPHENLFMHIASLELV